MDIVSRLKTFINYLGVPVTQFADTCKIPRPTLSQLLNGRNKKVSDEIIRKLHAEFPELNVAWLLFGEGDMLASQNTQFSEPQNASFIDFPEVQQPESKPIENTLDFENGYDDNELKKNEQPAEETKMPLKPATPASIAFDTDKEKKIVNIIVYYSDNSFESFIPGLPQK